MHMYSRYKNQYKVKCIKNSYIALACLSALNKSYGTLKSLYIFYFKIISLYIILLIEPPSAYIVQVVKSIN